MLATGRTSTRSRVGPALRARAATRVSRIASVATVVLARETHPVTSSQRPPLHPPTDRTASTPPTEPGRSAQSVCLATAGGAPAAYPSSTLCRPSRRGGELQAGGPGSGRTAVGDRDGAAILEGNDSRPSRQKGRWPTDGSRAVRRSHVHHHLPAPRRFLRGLNHLQP